MVTNYKVQSLKCIRAAINQYTKEHRNLDIISDVRFAKPNEMFKGVSKDLYQKGKGMTESYKLITDNDLHLIMQYLHHDVMNKPVPKKVQKIVYSSTSSTFLAEGGEKTCI